MLRSQCNCRKRLVARIEHGSTFTQSMQAHEPITNDDAVNQEELSCLSWRMRRKKLMTFVMTLTN